MMDILTGFAVIGLAIVVGYVIGRIDLLRSSRNCRSSC
jgi:hypothetical protein